jgi:hypothetical protein
LFSISVITSTRGRVFALVRLPCRSLDELLPASLEVFDPELLLLPLSVIES